MLRYAYMNSFYQTGLRNLLDRAVLAHERVRGGAQTAGRWTRSPSTSTGKRMSVVVDYEDDHVLICKGAVEDVFTVCATYQVDDDIYPLIDMIRDDLLEDYRDLSADGYRVLAIAYREFARAKQDLLRGRRERPDPARLHRLLRPAQGHHGAGPRGPDAARASR